MVAGVKFPLFEKKILLGLIFKVVVVKRMSSRM